MAVDLVILTGQSNAYIADSNQINENINGINVGGTLYRLAALEASENLGLGTSGVQILSHNANSITELASVYSGTSFLPQALNNNAPTWYSYINNDPAQGLSASTLEVQFRQWLQASHNSIVNQGTAINHIALISMQNESDESVALLSQQSALSDWENAKFSQRQDVVNVFGGSASTVPMSFFWVPANVTTPGGPNQSTQYQNDADIQSGGYNLVNSPYTPYFGYTEYNIHAAQSILAQNPNDNMFIAGNFGDASMRGDGGSGLNGPTGTNGGLHYYVPTSKPNDFQPNGVASFVTRLANHIANLFAKDAAPGSLVANNGYHMDAGPIAQSAVLVPNGTRTYVQVSFTMDKLASTFNSLSEAASMGAGWAVMANGSPNQNYVIDVAIVSSNTLQLHFKNPITSGQNLFYEGIGDGNITYVDYNDHITDPSNSPGYSKMNGQAAAVYDNKGMPIIVSAVGLNINGS